MSRRPARTLLEAAVANAGMRKGMTAATFAVQWSIAVADVGPLGENVHEAVQAYMAWWDVPERTAYRHLKAFREGFPGHSTPEAIAQVVAPNFTDVLARLHDLSASRRRAAIAPALAGGYSLLLA